MKSNWARSKEQAASVGGRKLESGVLKAKGKKCFQGGGNGQEDAVDRSGKVRTELRSESYISKVKGFSDLVSGIMGQRPIGKGSRADRRREIEERRYSQLKGRREVGAASGEERGTREGYCLLWGVGR